MKASLLCLATVSVLFSSCNYTTLENRRDMYEPQTVNGPYTRMLRDGIPHPKPVSGTAISGSSSDNKAVIQ